MYDQFRVAAAQLEAEHNGESPLSLFKGKRKPRPAIIQRSTILKSTLKLLQKHVWNSPPLLPFRSGVATRVLPLVGVRCCVNIMHLTTVTVEDTENGCPTPQRISPGEPHVLVLAPSANVCLPT